MFSLQQIWRARGQNRFYLDARGWEGEEGQRGKVAQTMYIHMNKCKNNNKNK
jgi:hypothetical protein